MTHVRHIATFTLTFLTVSALSFTVESPLSAVLSADESCHHSAIQGKATQRSQVI